MSIKISHESPLCLLQDSLQYNDYQYILPFFYNRFSEYKEFMEKYLGFTILDNGLFEGEVPTIQELIELINETKCDLFIVPDDWNDPIITLKNAKYWMGLKKGGALYDKTELMVVLQGKTFYEIELLYQQCIDLGYRYFAFNHSSIAYQNEIKGKDNVENAKNGRIKLIRRLWNKNIIKSHHYIHLLGATNIKEFEYYKNGLPGVINSVDTSNPIIKGIEEGIYNEDNFKSKSQNKMEKYFELDLDLEQRISILENIRIFKQLVNK